MATVSWSVVSQSLASRTVGVRTNSCSSPFSNSSHLCPFRSVIRAGGSISYVAVPSLVTPIVTSDTFLLRRCLLPCKIAQNRTFTSRHGMGARAYSDSRGSWRRPVPPRDMPVKFGSWYKEAVADRRSAPLLGSLKPGSLRWMIRQLADSDDLAEWAELAEAVLADPVYRDRLEWCEYERRLHRDGAAAAVQYAREAGWVDMTDTFAWSGVNMEMLGTSFTKPIPRTNATGAAVPSAPAVFPYSSSSTGSVTPPARKRAARPRQGRVGRPSGVNLAAVRAQQEQLARRQERRQRQAERRQQQTGQSGNDGVGEEGWGDSADEGDMDGDEVSSDWLLGLVQKQEALIQEKRTTGGRQGRKGSKASGSDSAERELMTASEVEDQMLAVKRVQNLRSKRLPEKLSADTPSTASEPSVVRGARRRGGSRGEHEGV